MKSFFPSFFFAFVARSGSGSDSGSCVLPLVAAVAGMTEGCRFLATPARLPSSGAQTLLSAYW